MSRLLFAAARGARIQRLVTSGAWVNAVDIARHTTAQRIHPEDAHLQYGPISSALHKMAEDEDNFYFFADEVPYWALRVAEFSIVCGGWTDSWRKQTPDERRIALCVMAEALADEGL